MDNRLQGQVALVTGASSGIGEATALALVAEGAKVALAARRIERLEALTKRITESGGEALALECNVADEAQVNRAAQAVQEKWGRLDILVNNAGISVLGPILGADTSEWRRAFDINVLGLMYATHAALPLMKDHGGGHIVNMSSLLGRIAQAGTGVYAATKWAVGAFSEALRQEAVSYKVRVTVIEPGLTTTEINDHITDEGTKAMLDSYTGSMRTLDASDIAAAVVYAVTQPPHVSINELLVRPSEQTI
jgi:NADP-dependent 3-hydroxy acid dehydrogenase YdfG